jgi:ABC-2 type transport system ATP-binding protein
MDNIVAVSHLKKSFKDNRVLKDVSFSIPKGSIFALLGSNGAGKTTTVRILSTLSKPDGGKAAVCGYDVVRQGIEVRGCISLTGQFAAVDEVLTGRENLRLIGQLKRIPNSKNKVDEWLALFKLEDAADRQVSTYSGGMRRRLDIAMSLTGSPGLDPQSRIAMWEMVKGLAGGGATVFLTTQHLEEAEYLADHIAILHEGRITAEGTPDELKKVLPQESVQLDFETRAGAEKAQTLLKDYHISFNKENDKTIDVSTDGSAAQFADVLNRLTNGNIPITRFRQKQPTLEDVFLTLTGCNGNHRGQDLINWSRAAKETEGQQ